ncbi:acetyl esterase/lipase [Paenibacillus phyllosphaerae]|uniref:Acetyl esterase/lipase n=1 Tax=Paenibacillus phyllosphaerae TaxID=274593 RepID=A0A7W5FLU9_9BACL|nr:alpha/beta hydrolase [Paenibacillus phyllosphaerae]MBB3109556.1 acetyl esterase/lipase [Paenibacillus phyllosphaerae]
MMDKRETYQTLYFETELIELWPEGQVPYAQGHSDEDRPAITPYLVEGKSRGAVIVCPGGGYGMRADHEGEPIARWLNRIGINAFVLRYRVEPYAYPAALRDVQRAVRTVRYCAADWGIDPHKIGVLGFSAGGHLTASAGTQYDRGRAEAEDPIERESSRPDLIVLCYPVITMQDPFTHEGSRRNLLGTDPTDEMVRQNSAELQVTADTPPAFLWHTADDGPVPVENSINFAMALRKAGVAFDLHVYEQGRHGLGLAEEDPHVASWSEVCGLWLNRYGFASDSTQG